MRTLIIAAWVCTFGACSCGPNLCTPQGGGGFGGAGGGPGTQQVGYVGQAVEVDLQELETFSGCGDPNAEKVTGISVEVLDPGNQKVAATATPPVQANGELTASVTFTPATPGPYHVAARFTPNGGTVQRDVLVAVDRRTLTPNQFAFGSDMPYCDEIDFDGQTLLCRDIRAQPSVLRTMRLAAGQGVTLGTVPADVFSLTDGKVWVYSTLNGLSVYGLGSDGSLTLLGSTQVNAASGASKLLAHGDEALFINTLGFQQFSRLADAGFSSTPFTAMDQANGAQWAPGLGAVVFSRFDTVCGFSLPEAATGPADAGSCTRFMSPSVVGYDDDGVWWVDNSTPMLTNQALFVSGWHAGQSHPTTGSIAFVSQGPIPPTGALDSVTPILYGTGPSGNTTDVFLPRFDGVDVFFERYPLIDQTKLAQADSKYIWFTEGNILTWYQR